MTGPLLFVLLFTGILEAQQGSKTWKLNLRLLQGEFAVCRLSPQSPIPAWAMGEKGFVSVTRTADELSIVRAEGLAPKDAKCERNWRVFKIEGPFDFTLTGILVSIARPLNEAGVRTLAISTYDPDYGMVKSKDTDEAMATLKSAGHYVRVE
jgi:uncharacterized protein